MLKASLLFILLSTYVLAQDEVTQATVVINNGTIRGNVTFLKDTAGVRIIGIIEGFTSNSVHGFHIHEIPDLRNNCMAAEGHLNPEKKDHGGPLNEIRHVGDLGNINATANGTAIFNFTDSVISLNGSHSILNRSIVIHQDADDLGLGGFSDSKTTGHAGARIGCGIIQAGFAPGLLPSFSLITGLLLVTLLHIKFW